MLIDHYDWSDGREAMLRFGPATGAVAVVALPLFEEANRTRAFAVTICRALAKRGVASVLPDLPGQGESLVQTEAATLSDWRAAFGAAAELSGASRRYAVAIRGGSLIDTDTDLAGRWHFAPMLGDAVLHGLIRIARAADPQRRDLDPVDFDSTEPIEIAGNLLAPAFLSDLGRARPKEARIVRLTTESADAALKVEGTPLWRRAEPDNDPALAALLADDIAHWIAACEG